MIDETKSTIGDKQSTDVDDELPERLLRKLALAVPGYTIQNVIAQGGQAIVLKAVHTATGNVVALKVLYDGPLADHTARQRLKREVAVLQSLAHPNIVSVIDSGQTPDGHDFLVMNYIVGRPLCAAPDPSAGGLSPDPAAMLGLFAKICSAVNFAHARGIVHRDLSPSNILIDDHLEPHILDFGLARTAFDQFLIQGENRLTVTGQFVGKLAYASPEQARGEPGSIDLRTDVYALGVILYQIVTGGEFPYRVVGSIPDILNNIIRTPPTPPSDSVRRKRSGAAPPRRLRWRHPRAVDRAMEAIVLKALSKNPDDRYQTAGELGRDVENYLAGRPTSAAMEAAPFRPLRLLASWRARWAALLAVLGLLLVGWNIQRDTDRLNVRSLPSSATDRSSDPSPADKAFVPSDPATRVPHLLEGVWRIDGDELVSPPESVGRLIAFGDLTWTDYDFTYEVRAEKFPAATAAIFRWSGYRNQYHFNMGAYRNSGEELAFLKEGRWNRHPGRFERQPIEYGRWYAVKIVVRGSDFRCFVDGVQHLQDTNEDYPRGCVGLTARRDGAVRFKNIQVRAPNGVILWNGFPELTGSIKSIPNAAELLTEPELNGP